MTILNIVYILTFIAVFSFTYEIAKAFARELVKYVKLKQDIKRLQARTRVVKPVRVK